jgi:hypothetical protein
MAQETAEPIRWAPQKPGHSDVNLSGPESDLSLYGN